MTHEQSKEARQMAQDAPFKGATTVTRDGFKRYRVVATDGSTYCECKTHPRAMEIAAAINAYHLDRDAKQANQIRELQHELSQWRDAAHLSACESYNGVIAEDRNASKAAAVQGLVEALKFCRKKAQHMSFDTRAIAIAEKSAAALAAYEASK